MTDSWIKIENAPLGVEGHVWSPSQPERVDLTGTIYEYSAGERGVSSQSLGMKFTLWHPFPPIPSPPSPV